jgi:O-antigen/teichoic acid export membrane protein
MLQIATYRWRETAERNSWRQHCQQASTKSASYVDFRQSSGLADFLLDPPATTEGEMNETPRTRHVRAWSTHAMRRLQCSRLARNIGWIAVAEVVSRTGRIVAAIVLARTLDAVAFGVAALALTVFELVRLFCENGIGASVVRAAEAEVDAVANTAYRLMWRVCLGLAASQTAIGAVIAWHYAQPQAGAMIALLSGVYLIMPFGVVHAYILQRREQFKHLAAVACAQTTADHLLTAAFALSGFGAWAIVLPKLLTAPIWLVGIRHRRPWKRQPTAGVIPLRTMGAFALPVLGAEIATAARDNADKLIVSAMLGIEALGIYYFAFNAGLGLSSALNRAVNGALYPHLCRAREAGTDLRRVFDRLVLRGGPLLAAVYVAQAGAALVYVPVLFGHDWAFAAPVVAVFCLAGPARLAVDAARALCRAAGRSGLEMQIATTFALVTSAGLAAGASGDVMTAAIGITVAAVAGAIACVLQARRSIAPAAVTATTVEVAA